MVSLENIIEFLDESFEKDLHSSWDTTEGLIQGNVKKQVKKITLGLEFNEKIMTSDSDLILLHHPPIFGKNKKITNPFYKNFKENVPIYALHSRLDKKGFTSLGIAKKLFDFESHNVLLDGTVIISLKKPLTQNDFLILLKEKLNLSLLRYIGKKDTIKKIAIHGGEAFQFHHLKLAHSESVDTYLGGDLTHHGAEASLFFDMLCVEIPHVSEWFGLNLLKEKLIKKFKNLEIKVIQSNVLWKEF